jgi:serine/threonine protein kinase
MAASSGTATSRPTSPATSWFPTDRQPIRSRATCGPRAPVPLTDGADPRPGGRCTVTHEPVLADDALIAPVADPCPSCGREVADAWLVCAWCGEQIAAPAELAAGSRLGDGRYQVLGVIGRGGFAITYEAGDRRLQRRVAIKELFPDSAVRHGSRVLTPPNARTDFRDAKERFLREARVLARFTHPGIVRVYEVFEEHGTAYLVMELLDGHTLVDLLRGRGEPFTETEVLDVAARVAAALRPVHAIGVLHRDVNPSNVMLTTNGRIVVIDFGLARDFDANRTMGMTRVVTPGYAPIEQYRGEARFGPTTDVYGLAATCYRLASGRVPVAAMRREAGTDLPALHRLNPAISKRASDAIGDGLELEPSHRPQDLDAFLARLGVRRLPDTPRSLLLDTFGDLATESTAASHPPTTASEADVSPSHGSGPVEVDAHASAPPLVADATRLVADGPISDVAGHGLDATRQTGDERIGAADATHPTADPPAADPTRRTNDAPGVDTTRQTNDAPGLDATRRVGDPDSTRYVAPTHGIDAPPPPPPPLRPLTAGDVSPRTEQRLPLAVGPHRRGRAKVTVPLGLAAVACASAAPVAVTVVVVLVALPLLATSGDSAAHRLRHQHGVVQGWTERRLSVGALAPWRFARNMGVSLLRALPMLAVGAALLGSWYALARTSVDHRLVHAALRAIGAVVVGVIVVGARAGSARFRSGLGLDSLVERLVPAGRITERLIMAWLVAALLVAAALLLVPSPWPLP